LALRHRAVIHAHYGGRVQCVVVPDLPCAIAIKAIAYKSENRARPAQAFNSRHLHDIVFLASLIDDPEAVVDDLNALGPGRAAEIFKETAAALNLEHLAWEAAGSSREDAQLIWEFLLEGVGTP
jgi:hypothetical protein